MFDPEYLHGETAQTAAYLRRLDSGRAAINYRSIRTRLWIHILAKARAGTLAVDWRTTLYVAEPDNSVRHQILGAAAAAIRPASEDADNEALVLHELVTMPSRPWEPYAAAGDWRTAINAWYADTLAIDEYRRQPVDPLLTEHLGTTNLRAPGSDVEAMLRALQEASYRAGLAAGGDESFADWQVWLEAQLKPLSLATARRRADPQALGQHLQQLPTYWTEQRP
jgi:hypothetical protein